MEDNFVARIYTSYDSEGQFLGRDIIFVYFNVQKHVLDFNPYEIIALPFQSILYGVKLLRVRIGVCVLSHINPTQIQSPDEGQPSIFNGE